MYDETLQEKRMVVDYGRIESEYITRERNFQNELGKQPERERILKFFAENGCRYSGTNKPRPHLLSMPSIHWSFEWMFNRRFKNACFLGLEWTWGVVELGKPYMVKKSSRPIEIHHCDAMAHGRIRQIQTDVASWIWMDAADFLSLRPHDCASPNQAHNFRNVYRSNNYVWLDFTSQICGGVRRALRGLHHFLHPRCWSVPVAITVMAARDDYRDDDDRVFEIGKHLSGFDRTFLVRGHWTYVNNGVPMLTVCGIMKHKWTHPGIAEMIKMHKQELEVAK